MQSHARIAVFWSAVAGLVSITSGCMTPFHFDTARVPAQGRAKWYVGGGVGIHTSDEPRMTLRGERSTKRYEVSDVIDPSLSFGPRIGVGGNTQIEVFGIAPLGAGVGVKTLLYELPDRSFALALGARGAGSIALIPGLSSSASSSNDSMSEAKAQLYTTASVFFGQQSFSITPRVGYLYASHADGDLDDTQTGGALEWGAAMTWGWTGESGHGLMLEVVAQATTQDGKTVPMVFCGAAARF